jgi:L-alanine-DL-glutamate epimerase-like enolase superfamily enzyme
MRIIRIEAYTVRVVLIKPYLTADYKGEGMIEKPCVILRMTTDNGLQGLGEADPFPTFTYESPETVMEMIRHHLGPLVLGMDPANLIALHTKMDAAVPGWPFAKAPIDIAAHDILGQALGVPVYQLLGGKVRDRIPMLWPLGGDTPEANAEEAAQKIAEGYRSLHIKLGALSPDVDVARVQAISQAVGPEIPLMVDVNQGWDYATALRAIRQLEGLNISMVEQPLPTHALDDMAKLQSRVDLPLSADESLHSIHEAMTVIRRDAARVFSLKNGKCGGLFRTRQIAAMAEAAGMPCFVNSMIEMGISVMASLHLAASVPNLVGHGHALMSNLRIKEDVLVKDSFHYDGKDILIPQDSHGLGITLDEDKLAQLTLDQFVLEL